MTKRLFSLAMMIVLAMGAWATSETVDTLINQESDKPFYFSVPVADGNINKVRTIA